MVIPADIEANLPLTEATFCILLSLMPKPKHGYAILKDVQHLSHGRVVLSTGTLYGALERLLDQGWIERVQASKPEETRRVRKVYALTNQGRSIVSAETTRLEALAETARLRAVGEQLQ